MVWFRFGDFPLLAPFAVFAAARLVPETDDVAALNDDDK